MGGLYGENGCFFLLMFSSLDKVVLGRGFGGRGRGNVKVGVGAGEWGLGTMALGWGEYLGGGKRVAAEKLWWGFFFFSFSILCI